MAFQAFSREMCAGEAFNALSPISTQTRDTRLQCGRVPKRTGGELELGIPDARPSGSGGPLRGKEDAASHSLREGGNLREAGLCDSAEIPSVTIHLAAALTIGSRDVNSRSYPVGSAPS